MEFRFYTESDIQFLRDNYQRMNNRMIAEHLNRTVDSIHAKLRDMKLIRTPAEVRYLHSQNDKARYPKGHTPHNTLTEGTITIRNKLKNTDKPYKWIKTDLGKWELYHRYIWKELLGRDLPKGFNVCFLNGDSLDCRPENLFLLSDAENLERNGSDRAERHKKKLAEKGRKARILHREYADSKQIEKERAIQKALEEKERQEAEAIAAEERAFQQALEEKEKHKAVAIELKKRKGKEKRRLKSRIKKAVLQKIAKETPKNFKGIKKIIKERQWAENFLKEEKVIVSREEKNKVPFRVDARTIIYIPADSTEEYKKALRGKYSIDGHVDHVIEKFKTANQ